MKPRTATTKTNPRVSFIETKWRSLLDLFDPSKLRRGKSMEKQGQVAHLSITKDSVQARIIGPKIRFSSQYYDVTLPLANDGERYQSEIAQLLYKRPDWLGWLLGGQWNKEFWAAISELGLAWYPAEQDARQWVEEIDCTCADQQMPCFHAAAALYVVLHEMEEQPLFALRFLGVQVNSLLAEVHRMGSGWSDEPSELAGRDGTDELAGHDGRDGLADPHEPQESVGQQQGSLPHQGFALLGKEEEAVYQQTIHQQQGDRIRHRLPPNWDAQQRKLWWERYMAWK